MPEPEDLDTAADLFRVLGSASRLRLLRLLADGPTQVGTLVERSGLTQPLVSQHLRTLRLSGLVTVERDGRTAAYALADHHVAHVIDDTVAHSREPNPSREDPMTDTTTAEQHAGHGLTEHQHGPGCGHESVAHEGHVDYVHDEHRHALHGDHYDEH